MKAKAFSLIELMIVVAIISILSAVAIPGYFQYILRSKTAEAPTFVKTLTESSIAFFVKPRYNTANGSQLPPCYLLAASAPNGVPVAIRRNFTGNANLDMIFFQGIGDVFFVYGVGDDQNNSIGTISLGAAGVGLCDSPTGAPTGQAGIFANLSQAIAIGDLDGDSVFSNFRRPLGTGGTPVLAEAGGLIIEDEFE